MNNIELLKILCNLVKEFMELQEDQVYIYNQKFLIPNDSRIYVCIGQQGETIYSNNNFVKENGEYINITKELFLTINIYGYTMDVLARKDEIPMCFKSTMTERAMDMYDFKIARIPNSENNIIEQVGTKMLYRFDFSYNVISGNQKIIKSDYYLFNNQKIFKE